MLDLEKQDVCGIIEDMNVLNTDLYRFFSSPLEHFPDRSARWLFMDPENVRGLVELVSPDPADPVLYGRAVVERSAVSKFGDGCA